MATEYTAGNGLDDEARREFEKESALMNKALGMSPGDTEDNCRWAAFYLSGKLGINSVDGAIYNNRKPMAPRDYLKKMQEVWKARDISTLYDDEAKGYRAIDGEAPDALEQRYAYAMQHASNSVGNRLGTMASRAVARDRITADELEWLTDEERKEAGGINKRMDERPYDDFSPMARFIPATPEDAKAYAEKARKHGENEAERKRIEKETEPRRAELKTLAEKRRAVAAYEKKLSEQNAWQTVLAGKQLLSEEGQAIVDMAEAHKDDLVGAVGEKFRELQRKDPKEAATLAAIIHALQPSADDNTVAGDAMRAFGRMMFETPVGALKTVVNVVERQIVGGEEYQRRREAEAEWRRAFEPMQKEHDFWGNAVVGFAGTIPYMAYAALPGGTAAVALSAANDFERQIVDQGGDVSSQEFQFARIAVGFGYAAIEKAQVIHPFRSIENRAWAHLYGTMTESVMSFLKTAGHQGMRYLGELGEEGLQGAVEQGFVAWGLGKDVASAAAKGLVEEAWGAIGPFAPLMALEAGSAKAAYRRGGFNAADMARQKLILDGLKDRAATAMDAANYGKAYGAIAQTWASMGENAALRQDELMRRYGVTADEALTMDQALGKMWTAVNGDAEAESAFLGGAKVKSAAELLSEVFTDAKVEPDKKDPEILIFSGRIGKTKHRVEFRIGRTDAKLDVNNDAQWESQVSAINKEVERDKSGKTEAALQGMTGGAKRMTVSEWGHLTPEARQLIADFFGLSVRGVNEDGADKSRVQRIKVNTSAADGSTEESDIDTTAFYLVSGKIDLTQNALPQAVFHEAMHSMIGFAGQMARAGDENAQAVLSALAEAYPALSGRESLDEESIADAYRDYLTGKIPLVEVQKSAFDKFFEFVGKWLGMIDDTGERAFTVANAQSAMNVFFNDVLTGNFSAIEDAGRLADVARARDARIQKERIERTEREAAAPTEAAGASARTADEKFGGAIVAAEDELVDENGETIPPDKVAEAAAQGKAIMKRSEYERRKAEGVVNIEDDNKISAGWALLPARTASDGASRIPTDNASILPQPAGNVKENLPQSVADALPGDASQYSIVAQNPLGGLSRDSIVVAMAAQDKLRGLSRPPELYAELAAALHANIDPATIQAEADKLISGNRERLLKTVEQDAAAATRETAAMFDRANFSRHVADLFSGSATFGSDIGGAATEGWHRILRDLMARAPGYDLDALRLDTGADLTKTLMEILPEVFAPSEKEGGGGEDEGGRNAPGEFVGPPTAETWAKWNESAIERRRRYSEIIARVKAELLARQAKIKEREEAKARRAEEARRNAEAENGNGDDAAARAEREANREAGIDENDADETLDSIALPREVVEGFGVDLANADEFASFMRAWVCDWLARKNPGTTYADVLDDPVALATYRRTMIAQLRDIANALLDPTEGKAAIMAERMISDIRDDAGADELERRTSDIIGFIQRNAIRQKRKSLIRETLDMIELMAVRGRKFDALERDMKRKILGEHEAYARYIAKVILMSDGAIQRETERLNAIIEGRRAKYGDAEAELGEALNWESDTEIHKAMEQLAALQQYGGLKNKMPSYIVAAKKQLEAWLGGEREAHERRWGAFQADCDEVAEAIADGVRKGRGKYAPDKLGLKGKIYEDVVASVRQRLEDMLVGAGTAERREAIGRVMRLLSEGSQQRESLKHRYRRQFEAALVDAAKGTELDAKGLLRKLEEQIPEELNDLLDSEVAGADGKPIHARQRVRMTWGQAMQLYASLMQTATYGENIVLHQRQGQVEAIRNAAHPAMLKLVSNLRAIYGGRREELSNTVRQVTGMPIYNPDPLYMPAKMLAGQREGLDAKGYAWSPLSKSLTPRVKNRRDFDLSADLLATYQGRTHDAVEAISFGVRGIALRSMLTRKAVVEAMVQSVGKERTRRLIEQVTDTLTDGYAIDEQRGGIMGLVRATGTATTYAALSFNLVTALKQMQSVSAWAPMLDGGYLEIGRHVANFDREAARELMNSPGFVARYGASGFAEMMRAALDDTEGTLIARLFRLGMTAVQIGDFVPGIVVGQGVYKARWQALMRQNPGMAAEAAKEQAATETWALIEECQQTSRLENTPHMLRRWGVMGRQVSKFATAPLQQVAHEIHTFKMWREAMAAGNAATAEEYRRKFVNTLISNHVLMPAAFYAVATLFGMALGDEPPEDEELFGDLLVQMVAGPWARLFFAGAVIENAVAGGARLTGLKPHVYPHADFPAAATVKRIMDKGFLTARDVAEADWRTVADDLLDEISIVNAPVRYATKGLRNWTGYDAAKHRREARKARAGK